jgi:hypothetical protein
MKHTRRGDIEARFGLPGGRAGSSVAYPSSSPDSSAFTPIGCIGNER